MVYGPGSQFQHDLDAVIASLDWTNPANFHDPFPLPTQDVAPPNVLAPPAGPPVNLGPPPPPPTTAAPCDSSSSCEPDEVCQVSSNRLGTVQGCIAAVDALLGIAYGMAAGSCVNGPGGRCLLTNPPAKVSVPFKCACNCTYSSQMCCDSKDGIVHEARNIFRGRHLDPPEGQCCNIATGHFERLPIGQEPLGRRCPAHRRGTINTRNERRRVKRQKLAGRLFF